MKFLCFIILVMSYDVVKLFWGVFFLRLFKKWVKFVKVGLSWVNLVLVMLFSWNVLSLYFLFVGRLI